MVRPHESKNTAFFEIYNEVTILLVTYIISVNTDPSIDEYARLNMGWVITAIIGINIIANFINIIQKMLSKAYKDIKGFFTDHCKKKQKIEHKNFDKIPEKSTEKSL